MNGIDDLGPEERAIAERLARLDANAGPSPMLDAQILAAAHDGLARAPAPKVARSHRRRWPVALGVAASLLLAVGIAWRLRPLPGPSPQIPDFHAGSASEAHMASAAPAMSSADAVANEQPSRVVASMPPPAQAKAQAAESMDSNAQPMREATAQSKPAPPPPAPPAPAEPQIVLDQAPAPAPSAAPAPRAFVTQDAADAVNASSAQAAAQATAAPPPSAAERANAADFALPETRTLDRLAAGARASKATNTGDEPASDVPPATMASPEARDAWLARIRELVANDHVDAARDSLQEFRRRYPAYPLPEDLRALAPESGPSPR